MASAAKFEHQVMAFAEKIRALCYGLRRKFEHSVMSFAAKLVSRLGKSPGRTYASVGVIHILSVTTTGTAMN